MKSLHCIVTILLIILVLLAGCTDPKSKYVEYSSDLPYYTQVYLDVVSITPVYTSSGTWLCKCRTSCGDVIWASISFRDFKSWISEDMVFFDSDSIRGFQFPCRLYGTVDRFGMSDDEISVELEEAQQYVLKIASVSQEDFDHGIYDTYAPVEYVSGADVGTAVYADVMSMKSVYHWDDGILYLATQCETTSGESVYFAVSAGDYLQYFSPEEKFAAMAHNSGKAFRLDILQFAEPIRLEGYISQANAYTEGLAEEIGSEYLIDFCPSWEFSTVSNVTKIHNYQPYSNEVDTFWWVYFDVISITPEYSAYGYTFSYANGKFSSGEDYTDYVICRCLTSDGQEIWVRMTKNYYLTRFDSSAIITMIFVTGDTIIFDEPLRFYGSTHTPDGLASGLGDLITEQLAIDLESVA